MLEDRDETQARVDDEDEASKTQRDRHFSRQVCKTRGSGGCTKTVGVNCSLIAIQYCVLQVSSLVYK